MTAEEYRTCGLLGSCQTCFPCDNPDAITVNVSATIITLKMGSIPQSDFRCEREYIQAQEMMTRVLKKGFSNL